jgi:hypothetical protein
MLYIIFLKLRRFFLVNLKAQQTFFLVNLKFHCIILFLSVHDPSPYIWIWHLLPSVGTTLPREMPPDFGELTVTGHASSHFPRKRVGRVGAPFATPDLWLMPASDPSSDPTDRISLPTVKSEINRCDRTDAVFLSRGDRALRFIHSLM